MDTHLPMSRTATIARSMAVLGSLLALSACAAADSSDSSESADVSEHEGTSESALVGSWSTSSTGALCGDGSLALMATNTSPSNPSSCLVIHVNGEGVCWAGSNWGSCLGAQSPATQHANAADYAGWTAAGALLTSGLFDRSDPQNPVASCDWATIPTCTADALLGDADAYYYGTLVRHRGRTLATAALSAIAAQYPSPSKVIVLGVSSGGMGSPALAGQIRALYPTQDISLLDDSGPWMRDPYETIGLQQLMISQWRVVLPGGCTNCAPVTGNNATGLHNLFSYAIGHGVRVAYMGSRGDGLLSRVFSAAPGDTALQCANGATACNGSPCGCEYGLSSHAPRLTPGIIDFTDWLQPQGVRTYISSGGAAVSGAPPGFGKWWLPHVLSIGPNALPSKGGPIAQGGCTVNQWAGHFINNTTPVSPCTANVL